MDNLKYDFSKLSQEIKKHHSNCEIKELDSYNCGYYYVGEIRIEDKRFTMYFDIHWNRIQIDCSHRAKTADPNNGMSHVVWIGGRYEIEYIVEDICKNININYL